MTHVEHALDGTGYLLWVVSHRHQQNKAAEFAELGLSLLQFGILLHVEREPGVSAAAITRLTRLTAQSASAAVAALVDQGHLERRASPANRRVQALHLTPAGQLLLQRAMQASARADAQVLAPLTPTQRRCLHNALQTAADALLADGA